mmetsp:Transcript_93374/g.241662  ORF Transcript_93374/g.241662 Transcript_93374/m.241662 type:complete len:418 (+) Transcript_93374:2479-3732(+)
MARCHPDTRVAAAVVAMVTVIGGEAAAVAAVAATAVGAAGVVDEAATVAAIGTTAIAATGVTTVIDATTAVTVIDAMIGATTGVTIVTAATTAATATVAAAAVGEAVADAAVAAVMTMVLGIGQGREVTGGMTDEMKTGNPNPPIGQMVQAQPKMRALPRQTILRQTMLHGGLRMQHRVLRRHHLHQIFHQWVVHLHSHLLAHPAFLHKACHPPHQHPVAGHRSSRHRHHHHSSGRIRCCHHSSRLRRHRSNGRTRCSPHSSWLHHHCSNSGRTHCRRSNSNGLHRLRLCSSSNVLDRRLPCRALCLRPHSSRHQACHHGCNPSSRNCSHQARPHGCSRSSRSRRASLRGSNPSLRVGEELMTKKRADRGAVLDLVVQAWMTGPSDGGIPRVADVMCYCSSMEGWLLWCLRCVARSL